VTALLDSFRLLIAADDGLRAQLSATNDTAAFLETALAIATRYRIALQPEDLAPLTAPDPLGLLQHEPPPLLCQGWPPLGWLPYALSATAVDWADFSGVTLDGGFQTIATGAALARPINRLLRCRMGIDAFLRGPPEGLRLPDGLVFHMSRCGSTLVARMLAALPGSYAVNEAEPLNALLRIARDSPEELRIAALRAMVGALGRRPSRRWFLKLSASSALDLPLFRRAFPGIPWTFLHRDPPAVIASQMKLRAPEFEPIITPPAYFGLPPDAADDEEDYVARVLARFCEAALAADGSGFVDHADLPDAFTSTILPHFGIGADEADAAALRNLPRWHAKRPDQPWSPDKAPSDPATKAAADRHLAPLFARLKAVQRGESLL